MKKISLNGRWTLRVLGPDGCAVEANVPGSVYNDLLAAGAMPDPFYRDNEMRALKLMDNDFSYTRAFNVPAELLQSDAVLLRAEGLDTLAEISVNGQAVGQADNMHRIWEFDVKSALRPGENTIEVYPGGLRSLPGRRQLRRDGGLPAAAQGPLHVRLGLGPPPARRGHLAGHDAVGRQRRPHPGRVCDPGA